MTELAKGAVTLVRSLYPNISTVVSNAVWVSPSCLMKSKDLIPHRFRKALKRKALTLTEFVAKNQKKGEKHANAAVRVYLRRLTSLLNAQPCTEPLPKGKRMEIFFIKLKSAPPASTAEEALELIALLMEEVEDKHSGIPKDPSPGLESDGRMYPPQSDMINPRQGGGKIAKTLGHRIEITPQGAMTFRLRYEPKTIVFTKEGR